MLEMETKIQIKMTFYPWHSIPLILLSFLRPHSFYISFDPHVKTVPFPQSFYLSNFTCSHTSQFIHIILLYLSSINIYLTFRFISLCILAEYTTNWRGRLLFN